MQEILELHLQIKKLIDEVNLITQAATEGEIIFFKDINIEVSFSSFGGCFSELINWSYAMFVEVCGPNLTYFEQRMKVLGILTDERINHIPKIVHTIRTVSNHNLDYSKSEENDRKKFIENWYFNIINKTKPETEQDYYQCAKILLSRNVSYLQSLNQSLKITVYDEFFSEVILPEWKRRNDRDYSVHDFELVFVNQLQIFGISSYLDTNKIAKREISKWREELKILKDGFDFKEEAAKIVTRYITAKKYCPVDQKDLLDLGASKGKGLIDLYNKVSEEFYNEPRSKESLLQWVLDHELI